MVSTMDIHEVHGVAAVVAAIIDVVLGVEYFVDDSETILNDAFCFVISHKTIDLVLPLQRELLLYLNLAVE